MRLVRLAVLAGVLAALLAGSAAAMHFDSTTQPPDATQGVAYTPFRFVFDGDYDTVNCYLKSGTLPAGMKIEVLDNKCWLDGTPTEAGTFNFEAEATCTGCNNCNTLPCTPTQGDYTLHVLQKLTVTTNALPNGVPNTPYMQTLTSSGGGTVKWVIDSGVLPPGLTMSTAGVISGTPTTVGAWAFKVRVYDTASPRSDTKTLSITVVTPLSASVSGPVPKAEVGKPFKATVAATGGLAPYTFAFASGTPPPGVNIDAQSGVVAGVPTTPGSYAFTVGVKDAGGSVANVPFDVSVARSVAVATSRLRVAHRGESYSSKLRSTGGVAPRTWKVVVGKLAPGLRLNPLTGVISGTPRKKGVFHFTVRVTDALKVSARSRLTLTVAR